MMATIAAAATVPEIAFRFERGGDLDSRNSGRRENSALR